MKPNPRGAEFEARAERFLRDQGLRILRRNYHSRCGEIDLIACDGDTLVFVEVRRRSNPAFGGALASVGAQKRQRLRRTALVYLQDTRQMQAACRFDVIGFDPGQETPVWIRDAFGIQDW